MTKQFFLLVHTFVIVFCVFTSAPLARPVSLAFILLHGQFQQFGSALESSAPPTRKMTVIDKICCQLIIRCLLHQHQMLAVAANVALNRECAKIPSSSNATSSSSAPSVSGLFSPAAWAYLDAVHSATLARAIKVHFVY